MTLFAEAGFPVSGDITLFNLQQTCLLNLVSCEVFYLLVLFDHT